MKRGTKCDVVREAKEGDSTAVTEGENLSS